MAIRRFLLWLLLCSTAPAFAETVKIPLQKLTPLQVLELRCVDSTQTIAVPVPERWKLKSATLALRYSVSNNLVGELSQLAIRLNDTHVAQTKLTPEQPNVEVTIDLPVSQLTAGYNNLSFHAVQHYSRQQCEQPCSPDLWTNISLSESYVQMEYDLQPVPLKLGAAARTIFDPAQIGELEVHLLTEDLKQDTATLATVVASGIARRFDYRKVRFSISRELKPGVDNVLIGSNAFAQRILGGREFKPKEGAGGLLKILPLPSGDSGSDPLHALIMIVDDKPAGLKVAAITLANMSVPYPDDGELRAVEFTLPDLSMYGGRNVLASDRPYDFRTLGLQTQTMRGLGGSKAELTFRLPADFLIKQNQYVKLSLNFSYGAGLTPISALNVSVNDRELRAIHLDNASGNVIDGYKIDVPTYVFKPGLNTIRFTPMLNTTGNICDRLKTEGLFVTVQENSTLYFPPMPHFVELPKLELFALNGFPFTRWPDGFETMVYLPKADDTSMTAALNVVGMITQRNGFPLFGTQVSFTRPTNYEGELLVVGRVDTIPKDLLELGPIKMLDVAKVPYPAVRSWNTETSLAFSKQRSGPGEGVGVVMQFESPVKKGRSVLVLTAQNDAALLTLSDAVLDPAVQAAMTGDLALVELSNPKYPVNAMRVGARYASGNKGQISVVDSLLFGNVYLYYGAIAFGLLLLAAILYWSLKAFRTRRLKGSQPGDKR